MKTFAEIVSGLVAMGVPSEVAKTVAAQQIAELQAAAEASATAVRQASRMELNADGIPCPLRRHSTKGSLQPVCDHLAVVLVPGSPSKDGKTEYGPAAVWYQQQRPTSYGASPRPVRFSAGSSSSTGEPEQSALSQCAPLLAGMVGVKFYVQTKAGEQAKEVTATEWITAAESAVLEFWSAIA